MSFSRTSWFWASGTTSTRTPRVGDGYLRLTASISSGGGLAGLGGDLDGIDLGGSFRGKAGESGEGGRLPRID